MTREELAYIAGVIDGEGCLSVTSNVANGQRFVPYLSVGNTSKDLIDKMAELTGGGSISRKQGKKSYYKDYFVWTARTNTLRQILPNLIEFLIVKREQGELVLELLGLIGRHHVRNYWLSNPKELAYCMSLSNRLREINKRSKPKTNKEEHIK